MKQITTFRLQLVREKTGRYGEAPKKITTPQDAYKTFIEVFHPEEEPEEVLYLMTLDAKNQITGAFEVSRGSLSSSIVHPREIFKRAVLQNASSILIAHNHPSGNPEPSSEDIKITQRLYEGGKILGIDVLDHIIIGDGSYISLKEKGVF